MAHPHSPAKPHFKEKLDFYDEPACDPATLIISKFDKIMKRHVLLHVAFLFLGLAEILSLIYYLSLLAQYAMVSVVLSAIFFTVFAYFILRLYFQTKKVEQLNDFSLSFLQKIKKNLNYQESMPECHIALANACCKFAEELKDKEYYYYQLPAVFNFFSGPLKSFSSYLHWQDVFAMRELLLLASVEEHIKFVKCEATSLEAHISLANAYTLLSTLYASVRLKRAEEPFAISKQAINAIEAKFRLASERAVEEFKILCNYAPNDIWVHEQLAYSYRELKMPLEEIKEYEAILKLNPTEADILFKLGVLYFQLGRNALGLHIYERLKRLHYKKAENLIAYYGAYQHE